MSRFNGAECTFCKTVFSDNDDVVVCPDCGAPSHRECYKKSGKCAFYLMHGNGFVWKNQNSAQAEKISEPTDDFKKAVADDFFEELRGGIDEKAFFREIKAKFEQDRSIFGVSEKEIVCFQGGLNFMRLSRYRKIASGHKVSLNLFAGLLSPYYFFYSRMRVPGVIIAFLTFLLNLPNSMLLFVTMTENTGLFSLPFDVKALEGFSDIFAFFAFALMILTALFYDYGYLIWMTRKIKLIRERFCAEAEFLTPPNRDVFEDEKTDLSEEYYSLLCAAGKPKLLNTLLDCAAVFVVQWILLYGLLFLFMQA